VEHDTDRDEVPDLTIRFVICLLALCRLSSEFYSFQRLQVCILIHLRGSERYVSCEMYMGQLQLSVYPFSKEYEESRKILMYF